MSQKSTPERLQKIIARSGLTSRRGADDLIGQGRVHVDGEVAHIGQRVDADAARVTVDGVVLPTDPDVVYYLLNKEPGVVSTTDDPQGRPTVVDVVPAHPRVHPVGRLDAESTGLLLLTNDGELTNIVTHPRYGIGKTYAALVEGHPDRRSLQRLRDGVTLDDGPARALEVREIDRTKGRSHLELVMGEGRNREVRRLCEAIGHPVVELHRTAIGDIRDRELRRGEWRELTLDEVRRLYAAAADFGSGPSSDGT